MTVVGVAGKYCAGKDTAARLLVEHGYVEINEDRIGHQALEECRDQVADAFGGEVIGPDGAVDRKKLGAVVFGDDRQLARLESIVHPVMVEMTRREIDSIRGGPEVPVGIVINAAILFRMRLDHLCDVVIVVTAPLVQRLRRARRRDDASLVQILRRLRSQKDVDPQYSTSDADIHSVRNDGNREQLLTRLQSFLPLT